ncbi:31934_t:CDS:2 [Racocetra persica]|uniref:31934_t:CDS:1 n=1 Tax=Racocetra persica TaxID=160502 RepID=A0ACA9MX97_9GLOM|nr:31934_t:CDS:2 [Racocetra persica]
MEYQLIPRNSEISNSDEVSLTVASSINRPERRAIPWYLDGCLMSKATVYTIQLHHFCCCWYEGFLMGGEACYDVTDGKVTRYGVSAGYTAPEYNVTLKATNSMSAYTLLYYHRVHPDIEAGAKAHWDTTSNSDSVNMEIGAKYFLDRDAFVKAKIDNNGRLGLGYTQALRPGVKISLGGSIDTSKLEATEESELSLRDEESDDSEELEFDPLSLSEPELRLDDSVEELSPLSLAESDDEEDDEDLNN